MEMVDGQAFLDQLEANGITLVIGNDGVGPGKRTLRIGRGKLGGALKDLVVANKEAVVEALRARNSGHFGIKEAHPRPLSLSQTCGR
jgi:hypothetical protein